MTQPYLSTQPPFFSSPPLWNPYEESYVTGENLLARTGLWCNSDTDRDMICAITSKNDFETFAPGLPYSVAATYSVCHIKYLLRSPWRESKRVSCSDTFIRYKDSSKLH